MANLNDPRLRRALPADLDPINAVIERALQTWTLPERVKRLALPSYQYQVQDLEHLDLLVAEADGASPVAVAAWELAALRDCPGRQPGLLLHGLYVEPVYQGRGLGSRLLTAAKDAARKRGLAGLLVKAQSDAISFFQARGFRALPVEDPTRDYPNRYWVDLDCTVETLPNHRTVA